ncbi:AraC family transcriptional regulator [Brucella pseudogrignonensis]|nr:AraC family transcriptional regulator [Brucella pseudogrignonensis]
MRLASKWLTRDRMEIKIVARKLGYTSQENFSRAFKRITAIREQSFFPVKTSV